MITPQLARLIADSKEDAFFLGSALAAYQRDQGLGDAGLAELLGVPTSALPGLHLCYRPDPRDASFLDAVERIAHSFSADGARLAALLQLTAESENGKEGGAPDEGW